MDPISELVRPESFESGVEYLLLERRENGKRALLSPVKFTAYDPCPAFVIVATERGKKRRCPRDVLFANLIAR